jgi:hypothetical protein
MKNKKGLSTIISSMLIIILVFVVTAIIWTTYKNLVNNNLEKASCLDTFGKINIIGKYTCYDLNSSHPQFQFSIEKKDIEVDEIIVSINSVSESKTFSLTNTSTNIPGLRIYPNTPAIIMPAKNSAKTYIVNLTAINFPSKPDEISVVPVLNGKQCEAVDVLNEIDSCIIQIPSSSSSGGGMPN